MSAEPPKKVDISSLEFKAVTLARLPPYVEWPPELLGKSDNSIIIGVVGLEQTPFAELLDKLLKTVGTRVAGRNVVVKVFSSLDEVGKPHILFVPSAAVPAWQEWSKTNNMTGVLTVGETEEFLKAGGAFAVSTEARQLEVNLKNLKKTKLEVNSKLLKIIKRK